MGTLLFISCISDQPYGFHIGGTLAALCNVTAFNKSFLLSPLNEVLFGHNCLDIANSSVSISFVELVGSYRVPCVFLKKLKSG